MIAREEAKGEGERREVEGQRDVSGAGPSPGPPGSLRVPPVPSRLRPLASFLPASGLWPAVRTLSLPVIPLRNADRKAKARILNRGLVLFTATIFLAQMAAGRSGEAVLYVFGYIPARLADPAAYGYSLPEALLTLATSLFFHGGVVHLLGNMVYLWVFGDDVEEHFGPAKYILFYIACGAAGSLSHTLMYPGSPIPSIGASGSIAGVLGAFLVFHPRARIVTLFPIVVSWALAEIPALVFLPIWFALQFINGWAALSSQTQQMVGIAWWAHIGGFVFGAIVALVVKRKAASAVVAHPPPP
jgi:membrane associated rhomboid family serine protease